VLITRSGCFDWSLQPRELIRTLDDCGDGNDLAVLRLQPVASR
jgi:hypothetical protein